MGIKKQKAEGSIIDVYSSSEDEVVAATPVPDVKLSKKGAKRNAEEALENLTSIKKQKAEGSIFYVSSSFEDDSSESEEELHDPPMKDRKPAKTLAMESGSSKESSSDEEAFATAKKLAASGAKIDAVQVTKKEKKSSDNSEYKDSDSG